MPELAELELPCLAAEEREFAENPVAHFIAARERHPWLARCSVGYVARGSRRHGRLGALQPADRPGRVVCA